MRRNRNRTYQNPADNPILQATIESLDQEGRGVAHVNGKTIFIDGALPNELVKYQSQQIKPSYEVAKTIEVLKQSNQRVTPKCPHFGLCGGCKLQHMDASAQVAAKQRMLEADLWHIGKVKADNILPPLYGPTWGYRHKARLSVKYVEKKQRVLVGFNEKATRYVADMNSCEVLVPEVSALIAPLQNLIVQLSIRDKLPQIELAVGEDSYNTHESASVIVLIFRIMDVLTANVFDSDLEELTLPSTPRCFVAQHFAAITQAQRLGLIGQPRGDRLGNQRGKLRAQSKNVAFTINEAIERVFKRRSHAFCENVVIVEDGRNDLVIVPTFKD